jgi:hypothetical protein
MATIYRFIIEQKQSQTVTDSDGRKVRTSTSKKFVAKKGKMVSIFGGEKGGVEHNRKMRAINPLLNRMTGGWWEKGMRVGRAGLGLVKRNTATGKIGISGPAFAILVAFVIQEILKWQKRQMVDAEKLNTQDFKRLENSVGAIHGQYKITNNYWNGRHTYNQNK